MRKSRRHSRRGTRRHLAYANPARAIVVRQTATEGLGDMILNTIIVGGVAVASAVLVGAGLARFAPTLSVPARGALKIGLGLALGAGVGYAMRNMSRRAKLVPVGVAVGPTFDGLRDLYELYLAPSVNRVLMPSATAPAVTAPGGRAMLGAGVGIPAGFAMANAQTCGV